MDDHVLVRDVLTSYRNRTNHYPSQASVKYMHTGYGEEITKGTCLRAVYYRCKGYEAEPFNARTMYIFACGNIVEDWFIEQTKQMGIWKANSVKFFNNDIRLSGEIDILVEEPETEELVIIEMKTTAGYYSWKEINGNMSTKGKAKPAHLLQLMLYLYEYREQVSKGVLLYFNLENKERKQFIVKLHEEDGKHYPVIDGKLYKNFSVQDIHARYEEVQGYIDRDQLPPRDFQLEYSAELTELKNTRGEIAKTKYEKWKRNPTKYPIGDWECAYCAYQDHCNKDCEA